MSEATNFEVITSWNKMYVQNLRHRWKICSCTMCIFAYKFLYFTTSRVPGIVLNKIFD